MFISVQKLTIFFLSQGTLDGTLPYPFAGEIKGISDASGINLGKKKNEEKNIQ